MKGSNTSFWSPYFLRPRKKFRHLCRIIVIEFKFFSEAFPRRCFVNKAFLKISSNFIGNIYARVSFLFPWIWRNFLTTPFLQNTSRWLLLPVALVLTVLLIAHPIIPVAAPQTVNVMEAMPKPKRIQFKL